MMRVWLFLPLLFHGTSSQSFNEVQFAELVTTIEGDVKDIVRELESLYESRCDQSVLSSCEAGNIDHCMSRFPDEVCGETASSRCTESVRAMDRNPLLYPSEYGVTNEKQPFIGGLFYIAVANEYRRVHSKRLRGWR